MVAHPDCEDDGVVETDGAGVLAALGHQSQPLLLLKFGTVRRERGPALVDPSCPATATSPSWRGFVVPVFVVPVSVTPAAAAAAAALATASASASATATAATVVVASALLVPETAPGPALVPPFPVVVVAVGVAVEPTVVPPLPEFVVAVGVDSLVAGQIQSSLGSHGRKCAFFNC
jgi:hypothetical protein